MARRTRSGRRNRGCPHPHRSGWRAGRDDTALACALSGCRPSLRSLKKQRQARRSQSTTSGRSRPGVGFDHAPRATSPANTHAATTSMLQSGGRVYTTDVAKLATDDLSPGRAAARALAEPATLAHDCHSPLRRRVAYERFGDICCDQNYVAHHRIWAPFVANGGCRRNIFSRGTEAVRARQHGSARGTVGGLANRRCNAIEPGSLVTSTCC